MRSPDEMVRVAHRDGRPTIDPRAGGRGAWICPREDCFDTAVKRRAFSRALRTEISSEALAGLRETIVTGTAFPLGVPFVKR